MKSLKELRISRKEVVSFAGLVLLLCCTNGLIDMVQGVAV
jgi:hypothetical protein